MNNTLDQLNDLLVLMNKNLTGDYHARPDNVYLEGVAANRELIGSALDKLLLPGSGINGAENLKKLYEYSQKGESCLLLLEHYSNFDYPAFFRLMEKDPLLGKKAAETLLPIQGMKLSEGNPFTAAFSNSYNTIVIYPSRSIDNETDPEKKAAIRKISMPINHAAMKELTHRKYHGHIILVFPSGTRYRAWDPDSKKGVREIYTYLKAFDHICFVGVNGNMLIPSQTNEMEKDHLQQDIVLFTVTPPIKGKEFREENIKNCPEGSDSKQYVVDQVMKELETLHNNTEAERIQLLEK